MSALRKREEVSGVFSLPATDEVVGDVPTPPPSDREGVDLVDVPAAVVCATCGSADCLGCYEERSKSGIVAIVAWERHELPMFTRLWATARSTTRDAPAFFEMLPDGPLTPAVRFAVVSELLAAAALTVVALPVVALVFPHVFQSAVASPEAAWAVVRAVVVGLPALAILLVLAHVVHAVAIDLGARREGAPPRLSRAVRFGLYASGWDLVLGPVGFLVTAFESGPRAALGILKLASGLPTRATIAFLRGAYRIEGPASRRPLQASYVAAALATVVAAAAILGAVVWLAVG